jgi:PAS domain S-box-containing protein
VLKRLTSIFVKRQAKPPERTAAVDQFRQLLETAPDAMVVVNRDGNIVLVNAQVEKLFGYNRQEMLGQRIEMLCRSVSATGTPITASGFFAEPRTRAMGQSLELFGHRKDGSEFPVGDQPQPSGKRRMGRWSPAPFAIFPNENGPRGSSSAPRSRSGRHW